MIENFDNNYFGVIISILIYFLSLKIYKKTKVTLLNPLLLSIVIIISLLSLLKIPYKYYSKGGDLIFFFLSPATVILALPLYKKIEELKRYTFEILIGITIGSLTGISSVIILGKILKLESKEIISLVPKSITTPIGVELSEKLGGQSELTILSIVITGITGAVIAPVILKIFKIENKIARGVAIGTSAHAVGTSKALEIGELEGAMSGLSIGIAGLITVLLSPIIIKYFL